MHYGIVAEMCDIHIEFYYMSDGIYLIVHMCG